MFTSHALVGCILGLILVPATMSCSFACVKEARSWDAFCGVWLLAAVCPKSVGRLELSQRALLSVEALE